MRALLRPLAYHSVFSPIETIVSVFVLATLAYFHILSGIKHSSFFSPTLPSTLRPAHARLSQGEWVPVGDREWYHAFKHPEAGDHAVELQQIVFSLDDITRKVSDAYQIFLLSSLVLRSNHFATSFMCSTRNPSHSVAWVRPPDTVALEFPATARPDQCRRCPSQSSPESSRGISSFWVVPLTSMMGSSSGCRLLWLWRFDAGASSRLCLANGYSCAFIGALTLLRWQWRETISAVVPRVFP